MLVKLILKFSWISILPLIIPNIKWCFLLIWFVAVSLHFFCQNIQNFINHKLHILSFNVWWNFCYNLFGNCVYLFNKLINYFFLWTKVFYCFLTQFGWIIRIWWFEIWYHGTQKPNHRKFGSNSLQGVLRNIVFICWVSVEVLAEFKLQKSFYFAWF